MARSIWRTLVVRSRRIKAVLFRVALCWAIGAILILIDQIGTHDLRFKLRGPRPQSLDSRIVLVDINERDWLNLNPESRNILRPLKEVSVGGDSVFWKTAIWERLLSRILADLPVAVGVTLHFGENIRTGPIGPATGALFADPRIVWGADLDSGGRALIPLFANTYNRNVAVRSLRTDDDGTLRRYSHSLVQLPHLGVRLAQLAQEFEKPRAQSVGEMRPVEIDNDFSAGDRPSEINFMGGAHSFPTVSIKDLLDGRVPPEAFHGKIVIIGTISDTIEPFSTPLGRMSRAEVIANITDNHLSDRIPRRTPLWVSLIFTMFLVAFTVVFILSYPQQVVIVGLSVVALSWLSMSAWVFDSFSLWIPAVGPIAQIAATYIVFLSHQVATNEERTWRLEQDRKASEELEQLKTNFVSMMSHDLKTPIAKIQAICDRLLSRPTNSGENDGLTEDLKNLRRSSDDLHRYIQSILQVTKIEARDFSIQKEPLDLNDAIERVALRLSPLAQEKGLKLDVKLEPLFSIEADPTLLDEMILNLIENAIKYTPPGGRVAVSSTETEDRVVLTVSDNGPGIPSEDQDAIWNKFTRGRSAHSSASGSGLGLYLVKYFVELHGGSVFLSSAPGQGTTIGFRLPV
ncbi:MAG: CHASE2 domain-containing protein [Bdellovibrionaceae bacterium]|nr:CHASE2 domain-containing protein [Pseudobdellovibrionaceae bacterium]